MKKLIVTTIIALSAISAAMAQDLIYRRNPKKTIECKIVEIGEDLVKYKSNEFGQEMVFSIDKNMIERIVFESGKEVNFQDYMFGAENYEDQNKNAIKIGFLSPLRGWTSFSYERSIKPGQSFEAGLGIIGLGFNNDGEGSGISLSAGYKFMTSPTYYARDRKYSHILKGWYFKPELMLSVYSCEQEVYDFINGRNVIRNVDATVGSLMLTGGKQWVFSDRFLIDIYAGVGLSFGNIDEDTSFWFDRTWHYGFMGDPTDSHLAFSSGIKIGYLF